MLRHSFALRWFSVGMLVYSSRLAHLSEEQARDFRTQFGDTWHLVQTMLGHRHVETTKNAFGAVSRAGVQVLLAHAEGFPVAEFMAQAFCGIRWWSPIRCCQELLWSRRCVTSGAPTSHGLLAGGGRLCVAMWTPTARHEISILAGCR